MDKQSINTMHEIISTGVRKGIGHLYTEDEFYDGNVITINGKKVLNFGTYSYLGLELNQKLKEAATDAIDRYGLQFGSSRTYLSTTLYRELESHMYQMFKAPTILLPTTTLGHMAVMPIVIEKGDLLIFDQHVHASVQFMVKHLELYGIPNKVIEHNNMKSLEKEIQESSSTYTRIWYMADGVYSMYGDVAPLADIDILLKKYPKFHLYVDDAHGMSWRGQNGVGYTLSKIQLTSKIIIATSLNKAFAAGGSVFIFYDEKLRDRVRTCGGPLIFAGQHQISALGASIACTKIHLSSEIELLQNDLAEKIAYCHEELRKRNLPDLSSSETPIFFIGVGLPRVGYNLISRLQREGFHLNLAVFPAVSENCTGVRFTINVHNSFDSITSLIDAIDTHFYLALKEEGRTVKDIERNFRKIRKFSLFN